MYCITHKDQFAERLTKGFKGGNYSDDGDWVIGDKGNQDMHMWCDYRPDDYPKYIADLLDGSCCIDQETSHKITRHVDWKPKPTEVK